ncbi:MAG: sigma-B regulation protein RsbU (phosphoserine phosphatase) [Parvicellaceae bacterium]|jgi:sigma-B regulation protein RsbU (phosphoserine phosphatase)
MAEARVNKLNEKLQLKEFKLNSLLEITKAINDNYSIDKILNIYEYILREQLGISKLMLYSKQEEWVCLLKYGAKGNARKISVTNDLTHIKEITVIESSSSSSLNSFDVVVPVSHKEKALAYLLIGDLNEDEIRISPTIKHMPFIQTLTNIIIVAIENKRLAKESIEQEISKKELEVAAEMQALLFPKNLPSNNRLDIAAKYETKMMVGGDYYDFFKLNNEEYCMCIADVSGKGVGAALIMSNFQANLRAHIKYHKDMTIEQLMHQLNEDVMNVANGEKFITFFFAYYNSTTKILKYCNAGHNYPLLTNGKKVVQLDQGCIGLGMMDEIPSINVESLPIESQMTLFCYTDGLVELENNEDDPFETERLIDIIHGNYELSMADLNEMIFERLNEYKGEREFLDDTAILGCRFF